MRDSRSLRQTARTFFCWMIGNSWTWLQRISLELSWEVNVASPKCAKQPTTWYLIQLGLKSSFELVSVTSGIKWTLQWNLHDGRISRRNVFPIEQEVGNPVYVRFVARMGMGTSSLTVSTVLAGFFGSLVLRLFSGCTDRVGKWGNRETKRNFSMKLGDISEKTRGK